MCGIAGLFDTRGARPIDAGLLDRMTDSLLHRGPDERGVFTAPGVGLGHRRLSIIDLSSGQQPMQTPDGRITVTYNGEIYNFKDVRSQLEDYGYKFRTHSDTEVILHAWAEWGEDCVKQFRGMFAFAIYDKRTQTLFLARDRLGVKPIYFCMLTGGLLLFGSELKAILAHPGVRRDIDTIAVEDFFAYGYIPEPRTILSSVRRLPAGHTLTVKRGQPYGLPKSYWDIDFTKTHKGSEADLADELHARMQEAVKIRLMSEVPLGAFLSGGVDSSAVVALMAGLSAEPVNTCSIGFDVPNYDESRYAQMVAERFHTKHRSRIVSVDDFELIDRLVEAFDEPFADASALPTYRVSELARETVIVALSGDGGDEMLAGYRRHRLHAAEERVRSALPLGLRKPLFGFLGRAYPKMDWAPQMLRAKTTFQSLGMSTGEAYFNSVAVLRDDVRNRLLTPLFRAEVGGYRASELLSEIINGAPAEDGLSKVQYADMKVWLPGDILTKVDRTSMAVSLEAREPLLDHKLLEWAAGVPPHLRIKAGQGKYLMKKAFEPHLPHDVLYRPKMGFVTPISAWFRGPLKGRIEAVTRSSTIADSGWFDMGFLNTAVQDHVRGLADHGRLLWQVLMFDLALKRLNKTHPVRTA
jgi:asparagine synthase (glutamine-hydrolysing)